MRALFIFDLDGTLSIAAHRQHLVQGEKKDWKAFYEASVNDPPNLSVIETMERLKIHADVYIFSGRNDDVRKETIEWLERNTSFTADELETALMMRHHDDFRADDILKKEWLDRMLEADRLRLVATFDDRDRVVKMWRENGITCMQVAPGDF